MNYAEMSDFEINKAVAEKLFKDVVGLIVTRDVPTRDRVIGFKDLDGEIVSFICADYCNSWADAGPIIVNNFISLQFFQGNWMASVNPSQETGFRAACFIERDNPLRAAMITYLMMTE